MPGLQKRSLASADQRQELKLQVYDGDAGAWHATVSWLRVDVQGHCVQTKEERGEVVARLRVPFRDLRILDPLLQTPYPTAIYIRERALVVNLQSIRLIITAEHAYIISVPDPEQHDHAVAPHPSSPFVRGLVLRVSETSASFSGERAHVHVDHKLPFELRALEAALAAALHAMEEDARMLTEHIEPILEGLTREVSSRLLHALEPAKAALNKQLGLIGSVKQELEDILDDDQDMEDMYLGRRMGEEAVTALQQMAEMAQMHDGPRQDDDPLDIERQAPAFQVNARQTHQQQAPPPEAQQPLLQQPGGSEAAQAGSERETDATEMTPLLDAAAEVVPGDLKLPPEALFQRAKSALKQRHMAPGDDSVQYREAFHKAPALLGKLRHMGAGSAARRRSNAYVDPRDIEGCEALLESHFTQADYTLRRLEQLKEQILSTEGLVAIKLDSRRNELVALNLIVVMITVMFAFVSMVAGIFGQNLHFSSTETSTGIFLAVTISSLAGAAAIFGGILIYARWKQILLIPSGPGDTALIKS